MTKHLSVSLPEYIMKRTVEKNPGKNKSEWVAELLLLGIEAKENNTITPEFYSLVGGSSSSGVEA